MFMETKPTEWHFKPENNTSEEIRQLQISVQLRHSSLISQLSSGNGMVQRVLSSKQRESDTLLKFS